MWQHYQCDPMLILLLSILVIFGMYFFFFFIVKCIINHDEIKWWLCRMRDIVGSIPSRVNPKIIKLVFWFLVACKQQRQVGLSVEISCLSVEISCLSEDIYRHVGCYLFNRIHRSGLLQNINRHQKATCSQPHTHEFIKS